MDTGSEQIRAHLLSTGKFTEIKQVVEGASARAFQATHVHLQKSVFLKVYETAPSYAERLLREARALANVTQAAPLCRNLVAVFDAETFSAESESYLLLQMEWIAGESLYRMVSHGPVGQQTAIRIALGILNGVGHLHARRIIHRDLKPANIMYADGAPKISDFGSVALLGEDEDGISGSRHSQLYTPPEAFSIPSIFSFASDLYQVGMVLYELVNGALETREEHYITRRVAKRLAQSGKQFETLERFEQTQCVDEGILGLSNERRLLEHGRPCEPYVSPHLVRIIRKATHPNPSQRHESAQAFAVALQGMSLPDWRPIDGVYLARDFDGRDWRVAVARRRGTEAIEVSKGPEAK